MSQLIFATSAAALSFALVWLVASILPEAFRYSLRALALGVCFVFGVSLLVGGALLESSTDTLLVLTLLIGLSGVLSVIEHYSRRGIWLYRLIAFSLATVWLLWPLLREVWDLQKAFLLTAAFVINHFVLSQLMILGDRVLSGPCRPYVAMLVLSALSWVCVLKGEVRLGEASGVLCALLAVVVAIRIFWPKRGGTNEETGALTLGLGAFSTLAVVQLRVDILDLALILSPLVIGWLWPWFPFKTGRPIREIVVLTLVSGPLMAYGLYRILNESFASRL